MIKIKINDKNNKEVIIHLNARRTLDGNIMVFDHKDIDIIIMVNDHKIVSFPKKEINDNVYSIQNDLFSFMYKMGIIDQSTIKAGNVYASMEAMFPEETTGNIDAIKAVLYAIYKWFEQEKPKMEWEQKYEEEIEKRLTEPSDEESTELGEVPEEPKKGTIPDRSYYFPKYMYF